MFPNVLSIGIIFNALSCGFVAAVALALVFYLLKRWPQLDLTMKAFAWFWWFTFLIWMFTATRYLLISMGHTGPWVGYLDIYGQAAVFFSGPGLFYYIILRVFKNKLMADILATASLALGLLSLWYIFGANGLPVRDVTDFSADSTVNSVSFAIFSVQISILMFLLVYNIISRWIHWREHRHQPILYEALYSLAILIYVILGSIDESKIITGWPLIAFRLFYGGAFMFAYLIMTQSEEMKQNFFVNDDAKAAA